MQVLILGLALLVGFWLIGRWFVNADPKAVAWLLKTGGIVVVVAIALMILITGRLGLAMAAFAFLLPVFLRLRRMVQRFKSTLGPKPGETSGLRTEYLEMNLDHDSGDLDGRVRHGHFAGRTLTSLNQGELLDLLREMASEDPSGVPVLEAYMDRVLGPEWREDFEAHGSGGDSGSGSGRGSANDDQFPMSEVQALDVLGLERGADEEAIKAAHRELMKTHHPDHGGSVEQATMINRAKDLLLGNP